MLLNRVNPRLARLIRLAGLVAISLSVLNSHHHPGSSGRELVVSICFAA